MADIAITTELQEIQNNLWGTNFSMWNEGSLTYRFTVEML